MLKSAGYLSGRMEVPIQQHQILIRATSKGSAATKGLFRPSAANHIDDASHTCAGRKPNARMDPACKKQVASKVSLSPESRGFGLRDSKRCNPGSDVVSEHH